MTSRQEQKSLGFTVHGDFITNFFREHMLEGDPQKTLLMVLDSFIGIEIDQARQLLRAEMKMEGVNNVDFVEDVGYTDDEMRRLCFIYRREREVPGVFRKDELKKWMKDIPPPEPEPDMARECGDILDAVEAKGYEIITVDDAKGYSPWQDRHRRKRMIKKDVDIGYSGRSTIVENPMDNLSAFIKNLQTEENLEEPATGVPVPHTEFTTTDAEHFTWLMSPAGDVYKVPYQAHDDWFVKYKAYIDPKGIIFDEVGIGNPYRHGWARFSGGGIIGMVVAMPLEKGDRPPKSRISQHMRRYAGHKFTFEDDTRRVFEVGIDFDRAMRLLNESYREE